MSYAQICFQTLSRSNCQLSSLSSVSLVITEVDKESPYECKYGSVTSNRKVSISVSTKYGSVTTNRKVSISVSTGQ